MDGHEYWQVIVEANAENILTIGWNWVGGRELSDDDEATIRKCAHHLLAFIGDPIPGDRASVSERGES